MKTRVESLKKQLSSKSRLGLQIKSTKTEDKEEGLNVRVLLAEVVPCHKARLDLHHLV